LIATEEATELQSLLVIEKYSKTSFLQDVSMFKNRTPQTFIYHFIRHTSCVRNTNGVFCFLLIAKV